jgi:hypothetical protein
MHKNHIWHLCIHTKYESITIFPSSKLNVIGPYYLCIITSANRCVNCQLLIVFMQYIYIYIYSVSTLYKTKTRLDISLETSILIIKLYAYQRLLTSIFTSWLMCFFLVGIMLLYLGKIREIYIYTYQSTGTVLFLIIM